MALLPDVHVNLDRPTIQHIHQLFLPFVPGGSLVVGFALTHPEYLGYFGAASAVGYFSRVTAVVFVAYVAGLMLFALSVHFGALFSAVLSDLSGRSPKLRPFRKNQLISQNRVWRTVANAFLGDGLAPDPPTIVGSNGVFTTSAAFASPAPPSVQGYDMAWNDWYNVLQDYVMRGVPILAPEIYFLFANIQATGWAIIIVSLGSRLGRHHLVAVFVIALLVILTASAQFGATYLYLKYDRLMAPDFTARLLAEIRAREDATRAAPGASGKAH